MFMKLPPIQRYSRCGLAWSSAAMLVLVAACANPTMPDPMLHTATPTPSPSPQPSSLHTTTLDVPLVAPSSETDQLVGRYDLQIDAQSRAGDRCAMVPDAAARRTFVADIHDLSGRHAVKLYGATFLSDSTAVSYGCLDPRLPQQGPAVCHQFLLTGNPDSLTVSLSAQDEWRGSEIHEMLQDGFLLQITGAATGRMQDGRITAAGTGNLWYGNGLPATSYSGCRVDDLRFTFTRR